MTFVLKHFEEIQELSDEAIMNYILDSSRNIKEFEVRKNPLESDLRFNQFIIIDDVKHGFDFRHNECVYIFPFLDEREVYQDYLNGGYKVPAKGFFWVIDVEVFKKELGLVEAVFSIGKMVRNKNDTRFLRSDRPEFREVKRFYFDYKKQVYIQIPNENELKGIKKDSEAHKHIQEFEYREKCLFEIYRRLACIEETYAERLDEIRRDLKLVNYKANNIREFLRRFQDFQCYLEKFFPVKMLFSHVSQKEYSLIIDYMESLKIQVAAMIEEVNNICLEFQDDDLDFTDKQYHYKQKILDTHKAMYYLQKRLREFVCPKDIDNKDAFDNSDGYIKYEGEFFPSLGTVELRRSLTDNVLNVSEWQQFENELNRKSF